MEMKPDRASTRPTIAWTLGDVAGIGPELVVKAWREPSLHALHCPVVFGSSTILSREARIHAPSLEVLEVIDIASARSSSSPNTLPCLNASRAAVDDLAPGQIHAAAGQAAYDWLIAAIDAAMSGQVDAIVTLPLHKEGLRAAGIAHPGHTEILAERTGTTDFGMMLYRQGLGVLHVTLHMSLRDALAAIETEPIREKIALLDNMMRRLGVDHPRLAVAAINPHASDGGLFGDEEARVIAPAVEWGKAQNYHVDGPIPADSLFVRAARGEFDGVVAMYHDQGHIALKLLGWREAVNITVGLPIIRTSVAHGTGYDIVGKGIADPLSLREAVAVAVRLASSSGKERSL